METRIENGRYVDYIVIPEHIKRRERKVTSPKHWPPEFYKCITVKITGITPLIVHNWDNKKIKY